jgi:hypothetical protein
MKSLLVVAGCLVVSFLAAFVAVGWAVDAAAPPDANGGVDVRELRELRDEIQALQRRLSALELRPLAVGSERANAHALGAGSAPANEPTAPRDPLWYLEQYVLSFADDAQGFEYYRLAVEAHVVELAPAIAALVRDGDRPLALRLALVDMFGKRRFAADQEVIDALLVAVRPPAPENLAQRALDALARIASSRSLAGLEAAVLQLRDSELRNRALGLLVELAGDAANAALLRLWAQATDDDLRRALLRSLNGGDARAALDVLRAASAGEQPVRLDAAHKVGEFDEPEVDTFVEQWRAHERDAQVLAALGSQAGGKDAPGWSAAKATGAPDADPTRDDVNAWASKAADMGRQWLQLSYATPMRANGVRIFEVNSPGAVAEVLARGPDGAWVTLWRGTANGGGAPLVLSFPLTSFAVRTIRLVLDTDRAPNWNEIDAVELLGPNGGQWAARASASSTYASQAGAVQGHTDNQRQLDAFFHDMRAKERRGR